MSFFRNWYYLWLKSTPAESVVESQICKLGVPYRVEHPFPHLRRVADFSLPKHRIILEIDGASHQKPEQIRKDIVSTLALENLGWRVVRFTNEEVLGGLQLTLDLILERVQTRPTLAELREALGQLPEPAPSSTKRRRSKPRPHPKKAQKSG